MRPILIALALILLATPAFASSATVSGSPVVRTGPGTDYPALGRLADGAKVALTYCTPEDRHPIGWERRHGGKTTGEWCLIKDAGWVNGANLVGWAAKIPVTPPTSLVDPPRGFLGRF